MELGTEEYHYSLRNRFVAAECKGAIFPANEAKISKWEKIWMEIMISLVYEVHARFYLRRDCKKKKN